MLGPLDKKMSSTAADRVSPRFPRGMTEFAHEVLVKYPELAPTSLTHTYSPQRYTASGELLDLQGAHESLTMVSQSIFSRFAQTYQRPFDRYGASAQEIEWVRQAFYDHPDFKKALDKLDIPQECADFIKIPWFNEIAGGEARYDGDGDSPRVVLCPRHSYETQLMRVGVYRPVRNVSVMALMFTKPDPETGIPSVVIGLRGGKSYYNTFHLPAGALELSEGLKAGSESIFDVFERTELYPETGITGADASIKLWGRIDDRVLDQGPGYIFRVDTGLSSDEVLAKFVSNGHIDRGEHRSFTFIPCRTRDIQSFIRRYYKGAVVSDNARTDDELRLLHPAALVLAGLSDMPLEELRTCVESDADGRALLL